MWSRLIRARAFERSKSIGILAFVVGCLASHDVARAEEPWPEKLYNPAPIAGDVILTMPCGGSMVFRRIDVPGTGILDDYQVKLGDPDADRAFSEYSHVDYIAAPFLGSGASRYFLLAKYEVTRLQYDAIASENCPTANLIGRTPVTEVTWLESATFAAKYTDWLLANAPNELAAAGGATAFLRLPTEVEWEYATRGGIALSPSEFSARTFPMPDGLERYVWYGGSKSANNKLQLTGLLGPNPLGLHDLLGNADEFVADSYRLNRVSRAHGRVGGYVVKGGNYLTSAEEIRSAYRSEVTPFTESGERRSKTTGFRLAVSATVLTDQQDISDARAAWEKLGKVGAKTEAPVAEDQPLDDPVLELQALAQQANDDPATKSRLENLEQKVKSVLLSMQDQQGRAGRTLLRLGAWLGQQLHIDMGYTEALRAAYEGRKAEFGEGTANSFKARLDAAQKGVDANMKIYANLVAQVADDYDAELVDKQQSVLNEEFISRGVPRLVDYTNVFLGHVRQYDTNKETRVPEWLADLTKVAE
jgi:hypothetical protein